MYGSPEQKHDFFANHPFVSLHNREDFSLVKISFIVC